VFSLTSHDAQYAFHADLAHIEPLASVKKAKITPTSAEDSAIISHFCSLLRRYRMLVMKTTANERYADIAMGR
jgi:hypothetical protein